MIELGPDFRSCFRAWFDSDLLPPELTRENAEPLAFSVAFDLTQCAKDLAEIKDKLRLILDDWTPENTNLFIWYSDYCWSDSPEELDLLRFIVEFIYSEISDFLDYREKWLADQKSKP